MARPERQNEYIAIASQSVFGTKPTNPTLQKIPFTDHSIGDVSIATKVDEGVHDNGQARFVSYGNKTHSGDINAPFLYSAFKWAFQNVLRCTPETITDGVRMKIDSNIQYLYVEHGYKGTTLFTKMDSAIVTKLDFEANLNGDATLKITIMSRDAEPATSSQSTSDPTDEVIEQPLKHNGGYFKIDGVTSAVVMGVKGSLDRQAAGKHTQWGNNTITRYTSPGITIPVTLDLSFESVSMLDKLLSGDTSDIEFSIEDVDGNIAIVKMPRAAIQEHKRKTESDGSITATIQATALYDETEESAFVIDFIDA